jgi:fucose 4-O-acetylase-like acetyltransferase
MLAFPFKINLIYLTCVLCYYTRKRLARIEESVILLTNLFTFASGLCFVKNWFSNSYLPSPEAAADARGRVYYFDNLKFLLILIVVIGHFINPLTPTGSNFFRGLYMFIYSFHMPLFIFASGYFAKSLYSRDGRFRSQRVVQMLVIYLFMVLAIYLINHYIRGVNTSPINPFYTTSPAWYMLAAAFWYTSVPIMKNALAMYALTGTILFAVAVGFFPSIGDFLSLSRSICFYPFFLAGYFATPDLVRNILDRGSKPVRAVCAIVLIAFLAFSLTENIGFYELRAIISPHYHYDGNITLMAFERFVWYFACSLICLMFMMLVPRCKTFYTKLGARTLQIFTWHAILIRLLMAAGFFELIAAHLHAPWAIILPLVSAVAVTFILSWKPLGVPLDLVMKCKFGFR